MSKFFNELSEKDVKLIDNFIQDKVGDHESVGHLLREWSAEKETLYKMFGNHHTGFQIAESFENDGASGFMPEDSGSGKQDSDPFNDNRTGSKSSGQGLLYHDGQGFMNEDGLLYDKEFLKSKELEGAFGTEKDIVWTLTSENAETAKTSPKMEDGGETAGTSPDLKNGDGKTTGTSPDLKNGARDAGEGAKHGSAGKGSGGKKDGPGADADAQSVSGNGEAGEKDGDHH